MSPLAKSAVPVKSAVVVDHVSKSYGVGDARAVALDDVSFDVNPGELVMITGPSGSGKSSILSLMGGLQRPDSGRIHIVGTDLYGLTRTQSARLRRRAIGFVFQDHNLVSILTAAENVALPLELDGVRPRAARKAALEALDAVGLKDAADRWVMELSAGYQQRVAIARAITGEKRVILADEPTGALDQAASTETMRLLRQQAAAGSAVIVVTHEPETLPWADRVIELSDGKIVSDTTVVASAGTSAGATGAADTASAHAEQSTASLFDDDVLLGGTE